MRHYRQKKKSRILRSNPLKPKILEKRIEDLLELGIAPADARDLTRDLSGANVDPKNAIYVLDWWKTRLSLIAYLGLPPETPENAKELEKKSGSLLNTLQQYIQKYKVSAWDLALDGELQIDHWISLQHFIQMSGTNPYFKQEWPVLHRVRAELRANTYTELETFAWLGKLAKETTKLSSKRCGPKETGYGGNEAGYRKGDPAIKLLRGAYIGDPVGAEAETEIPKAAILSMEETFKPSDVIEFLKDAESNLQTSTYFIPKYHQPFMTLQDGKAWTVIGDEDKENEKQSLGDCATGEYRDASIIVISLREPIMTSPEGTFYRTRLRAEIVFPRGVPAQPTYDDFNKSVGVINQLRGYANSKPQPGLHKYIVPLLAQPWIGQLILPEYNPDAARPTQESIFWLSDLSPSDRAYLETANPKLFDAKAFYDQVKSLNYPQRVETKIMEGIEFPTSYIIQMLSEIESTEFEYHNRSPRSGIITRALERRLQEKHPDPELKQLLEAAENSLVRLGSAQIASTFQQSGVELSIPRIEAILRQDIDTPDLGSESHLVNMALISLREKLTRKEEGLETAQDLVRQKLLVNQRDAYHWPQKWLGTGVALKADQIGTILHDYHNLFSELNDSPDSPPNQDVVERVENVDNEYLFKLTIDSLKKLSDTSGLPGSVGSQEAIAVLTPLLEGLVLDTKTPYSVVETLLATNTIELPEKQICALLQEEKLLPGRTLAALISLKAKVDSQAAGIGKVHPRTLAIAQRAMPKIKDHSIGERAAKWIGLPIQAITKVLREPNINQNVRNMALIALKRKIDKEEGKARNQAYNAVSELMLRTKNKAFIKELLSIYQGHQHQYRLFHRFMVNRLPWLTLDRNRKFFLSLISDSLPKSRISHRYETSMPKPLYRLLRKIVADNLVEDNITFLLQILFDTSFDTGSAKAVGALMTVILDVIIKDPKKLTKEFCSWYQHHPGGWGSSSHKTFKTALPLTPKLLRQFQKLLIITKNTSNNCYLDLAVTVGQAMSGPDRENLKKLAMPLVKASFEEGRSYNVNYREFLERLMPRRQRKARRR